MPGTYRAQGIVLRRTKLGETDLIVTLLGDMPTQIRAVAKGARKPGSRLSGVMNLGNEVELLLHEGRSLDVVTEGHLVASHAGMATDFERMTLCEAVLDCAAELTAEGEHDPRVYPLTVKALGAVEEGPIQRLPLLVAAYVFKAAAMQGFRPSLDVCVRCGEEVVLEEAPWHTFSLLDGGVVCAECAGVASGGMMDAATLGWVRSLVGLRFDELLAMEPFEGEARLGHALLDFAARWVSHYPGIRPRALDFALTQ